MARQADAIIIGAGVIGAATAFELGKRGYKTLNIDKLPERGLRADEQLVRDRARALLLARGRRHGLRGLLLLAGLGALPRRRRRHGDLALHAVRHGAAQERHRPPREGPRPLPRPRRRVRGVGQRQAQGEGPRLQHGRLLAAQAPRRPALLGRAAGRARRRDLHPRLGLRQRPAARHPQPAARGRVQGRRVPLPRRGRRDPPRRRPRRRRHAHRRHRDRRADRGQRRRARTRSSSTAWPASRTR